MKSFTSRWLTSLLTITALTVATTVQVLAAPAVTLCAPAQKPLPIVISATASDVTKTHAQTLATQLARISHATFSVTTGDGAQGIAVGKASDFPNLKLEPNFDLTDPLRREEYLIRTHASGVYLIGATDLAVSHAVWDLLYHLGYRQFFPSSHWEVVPDSPTLKLDLDTFQKPDYLGRRIWYGFGSWKPNMQDKAAWDTKNRMAAGIDVSSGHAYDSILKNNKAEFDAHPEYLTAPKSNKFCISNPGLRKMVVDYALDYFAKNPNRDSISMEPSDGGGWECGTSACQDDKVFTSVSDRVVTLANEVADAVQKKYPGKIVGIYAYYQHSPPPTIKVHPNVSVTVATAYIQGGYTFPQLMEGWKKQGTYLLGVREYFSVFDAHRDRPAGPSAANFESIPVRTAGYHELGGRLMSAESTESWGPAGLGYYMASRLLWDGKEDPAAITTDFMQKAFGPAEAPMRRYYGLIDKAAQPLFTRNLLGHMYRELKTARDVTKDPAIMARLDDLTLWTRYCEMMWDWENVSKDKKGDGEAILRFTYRWNRTGMLHNYVLLRHSYKFDKDYPAETKFMVPEGKNPWKSTEPIPAADIPAFVEQGIANNPIVSFTPVTYSKDLRPATPLNLKSEGETITGFTRMEQNYYVWVENPAEPLKLSVLGGQIAPRGNSTLTLYPSGGKVENAAPEEDEDDLPPVPNADAAPEAKTQTAALPPGAVAIMEVPNDATAHVIELKAKTRGLHRLRLVDRGKGCELKWLVGTPVVIESSRNVQTLLRGGKLTRYFYVPHGTKVLGGFARSRPMVFDGDGKLVQRLSLEPGFFEIPIPAGQDGKLWRVDSMSVFLLMTVPPYLARSASELMLPNEVILADSAKR